MLHQTAREFKDGLWHHLCILCGMLKITTSENWEGNCKVATEQYKIQKLIAEGLSPCKHREDKGQMLALCCGPDYQKALYHCSLKNCACTIAHISKLPANISCEKCEITDR